MENENTRKNIVGTLKYGKLLSAPAVAVQWTVAAVSIAFLALLGYALAVARGDMAVIVGWSVWGLWTLTVLGIVAELIVDLFNRRLVARYLKSGDLQEGEVIGFSPPFPLSGTKVTMKISLSEETKTLRIRDRTLLRALEEGRAVLLYSAALGTALVAMRDFSTSSK